MQLPEQLLMGIFPCKAASVIHCPALRTPAAQQPCTLPCSFMPHPEPAAALAECSVSAMQADGFRFDIMGHLMVSTMQKIQSALEALTLELDGVDGRGLYIYGEAWDFGEV
jgi:hypothetical protein